MSIRTAEPVADAGTVESYTALMHEMGGDPHTVALGLIGECIFGRHTGHEKLRRVRNILIAAERIA